MNELEWTCFAFTVPTHCVHSAHTVPLTVLTVASQCLHNVDTVRFTVITGTLTGEKCPTAQLQTVQQL